MELTWKYVKPLNDPTAVKSFLQKHNVSLPASLIEIIEKYNGGRPSEKIIVTADNNEYVFKSLLSFNRTDKETIYSIYPDVLKETNLFPFASDAAGNFICYDLKKKKTILYNHETAQSEDIIKMALNI